MIAEYIDSIILFCVGLWASGVVFGRLPAPTKDTVAGQKWLAQYGKLFRIAGPSLVAISLILAAGRFFGLGA
jgi:hypothetical protein